MAASTRHAALGAILGAPRWHPCRPSPALRTAERSTASPEPVRLIARHDRIDALRHVACDADGMGCNRGLVQAAGAIRARVSGTTVSRLPDILRQGWMPREARPAP